MTIFQFVLASLACYRLTVLLSRDSIAKPLRAIPVVGPVIGCHFCISMWLAGLIEIAFFFSGVRDTFVVSAYIVLAMSAITIALDRVFTSDHVT